VWKIKIFEYIVEDGNIEKRHHISKWINSHFLRGIVKCYDNVWRSNENNISANISKSGLMRKMERQIVQNDTNNPHTTFRRKIDIPELIFAIY
jgi:hypothetical protein